ncbi:MAG: hypothetical protein HY287_14805 [Planctomycetes bacterium]|nr:hypothetical protein [Planctomycetota bacterium]MBI3835594.1 hypothetical protein [Planctomycetota bacterium]
MTLTDFGIHVPAPAILVGVMIAFVSGAWSLGLVVEAVKKVWLHNFAIHSFVPGGMVLVRIL